MNSEHQYCIILAGGAGKRFWPVSRECMPKQFVPILELGTSFLRHTFDRFSKIVPADHILVVTTKRYVRLVKNHLPELSDENLIVEPLIRDTAPSLTYATYKLMLRDPEATVVVTPSDHLLRDMRPFVYTLRHALDYASKHDELIVLGTVPTRPDTNFGYIQKSPGSPEDTPPFKVKTFTEKPDAELAKIFVESGEFLWNAGIFIWNVKTIKKEIEECLPLLASQFEGWQDVFGTSAEKKFIEKVYGSVERQSISYGILEKSRRARVYPVRFRWDDIGEWQTYYDMVEDKDPAGNVIKGGFVHPGDSKNCLMVTTSRDKMMAIQGLDSFMVIDTDDILLICPKDADTYKRFVATVGHKLPEKYK